MRVGDRGARGGKTRRPDVVVSQGLNCRVAELSHSVPRYEEEK